jgi:uncharacterized membrane protein
MTGTMTRLWRHFVTDRGEVHRRFSKDDFDRIKRAVAEGEKRHSGQVCFAIEAALPLPRVWRRVRPRVRALEVFGLLRIWDTEGNDGVLLYILVADHAVEIVADRGIHARVGDAAWQTICHKIEAAFRAGRFVDGVEQGLVEISTLLATHSPRTGPGRNEISDAPVVL